MPGAGGVSMGHRAKRIIAKVEGVGLRGACFGAQRAWRTAFGSRRTVQDNKVLFAGYSSLVTGHWILAAVCGFVSRW